MTIDELTLQLGGELVSNTARVRRGGTWIVLGSIVGNQWQVTEAGQKLLDAAALPVEPESAPPTRRTRQRKPVEVATDGDD